MDPQKDHDLLIGMNVKITTMCKKMEKFHDENRQDHLRIMNIFNDEKDKTSNKLDKKADKRTFMWITGILIFLMISVSVWTSTIDVSTQKCFNNIETQIHVLHPNKDLPHIYKIPTN